MVDFKRLLSGWGNLKTWVQLLKPWPCRTSHRNAIFVCGIHTNTPHPKWFVVVIRHVYPQPAWFLVAPNACSLGMLFVVDPTLLLIQTYSNYFKLLSEAIHASVRWGRLKISAIFKSLNSGWPACWIYDTQRLKSSPSCHVLASSNTPMSLCSLSLWSQFPQ